MNKPKSVLCHQYAVGRGSTGYGFIRYSWGSDEKKKDEFSISPAKGLQLRFSQLSDNIARILEIDPASTDYKHVGVFMTQRRLEAGTASIYTDVLITDQPDAEAAFQLLHEDNFLTPDQFSQLTHNEFTLDPKEIDLVEAPVNYKPLTDEQKNKLGAFLERYWALLEEREFPVAGRKPEVALIIPELKEEDQISFFRNEVVHRLPEYVKPAVSVSFGTNWENRGAYPCVCAVLADESSSPFPCYVISDTIPNKAKRPSVIEQRIGKILMGPEEGWPEVYKNIEKLAGENDRFRIMARSYSTMAYSVWAELLMAKPDFSMEDIAILRDKIYAALVKLGKVRFRLEDASILEALLPLSKRILEKLIELQKKINLENTDEYNKIIEDNVLLHNSGIDPEKLTDIDWLTMQLLNGTPIEESGRTHRAVRLWGWYEKRMQGQYANQPDLLTIADQYLECMMSQSRLDIADIRRTAIIRADSGIKKAPNENRAFRVLSKYLKMWKEYGFDLGDNATEEQKQYNSDHFDAVIASWLNDRDTGDSNTHFEEISWEISDLNDMLKSIRENLKKCPQMNLKKRNELLKPAEEKLYTLYAESEATATAIKEILEQSDRLINDDNAEQAGHYLRLLQMDKYTAGISGEEIQIIASLRARLGIQKRPEEEEAVQLLALHMETWQSADHYRLRDEYPSEEKKYNTKYFDRVVSAWLNGNGNESTFDLKNWSMESLKKTLDEITSSLKRSDGDSSEKRNELLEKAETKLFELHGAASENEQETMLLSALRQCIRLKAMGNTALSQKYQELILDNKYQAQLNESLHEENFQSLLQEDPETGKIITNRLNERLEATEASVSAYLSMLDMKENKGQKIDKAELAKIVRMAADARDLKDKTGQEIASRLGKMELDLESLGDAMDLALAHSNQDFAIPLLKKLLNNAAELQNTDKTMLYRKLEDAAVKLGNDSLAWKEAMERMLEQSSNVVPEGDYPKWNEVRQELIRRKVVDFLHDAETLAQKTLEKKWNDGPANRVTCKWDQITREYFTAPVHELLKRLYEVQHGAGKAEFLAKAWEEASIQDKDKYRDELKTAVIELANTEYDSLWKDAGMLGYERDAAGDTPADQTRNLLDATLDSILEDEDSEGKIRGAKLSEAYKAREFQQDMKAYCEKDGKAAEAGALIRKMLDNQGYSQCLNCSAEYIQPRVENENASLMLLILSEISRNKTLSASSWSSLLNSLHISLPQNPWIQDGPRTLNQLAWLTQKLTDMNEKELMDTFGDYMRDKVGTIWNKKINKKLFAGRGERVLPEPLYRILNKE